MQRPLMKVPTAEGDSREQEEPVRTGRDLVFKFQTIGVVVAATKKANKWLEKLDIWHVRESNT